MLTVFFFCLVGISRGDFSVPFFSDSALVNAIIFSVLSAGTILSGIASLINEKSWKRRKSMAIIGLCVSVLTVVSSFSLALTFYLFPSLS